MFNGTSTQNVQCVPAARGRRPVQAAKDGRQDKLHNTLRNTIIVIQFSTGTISGKSEPALAGTEYQLYLYSTSWSSERTGWCSKRTGWSLTIPVWSETKLANFDGTSKAKGRGDPVECK